MELGEREQTRVFYNLACCLCLPLLPLLLRRQTKKPPEWHLIRPSYHPTRRSIVFFVVGLLLYSKAVLGDGQVASCV